MIISDYFRNFSCFFHWLIVPLAYGMFFYIVLTPTKIIYLLHPLYEVPSIRVNTGKAPYTFTSVKKTSSNQLCGRDSEYKIGAFLKFFSIFCGCIF